MSNDVLEQRLAAIERSLAELKQKVTALVTGPDPKSRWWENITPLTEEQIRMLDEDAPCREYFRQTGKDAPEDWKPGDPIPEPDYWK